MKSYVDWLIKNCDSDDICDPALNAQEAINFLCNYLLGQDWYVATSESAEQVNSVIVHQILKKYSKRYRKELKKERNNLNIKIFDF